MLTLASGLCFGMIVSCAGMKPEPAPPQPVEPSAKIDTPIYQAEEDERHKAYTYFAMASILRDEGRHVGSGA